MGHNCLQLRRKLPKLLWDIAAQAALTSECLSRPSFGLERGVPYNHPSNHSHFSVKPFLLGCWNRTEEKLTVIWLMFLELDSAFLHLWLSLGLSIPGS